LEADGEAYDPALIEERTDKLFAPTSGGDHRLQLMTLHRAKGLEFDHVFIPNLAHATRGERRDLLLWDEYHAADGRSCFMLAMDDQADDRQATLYNYLHRQRRAKRRAEATRLLYVGATRAAKRLYLSASLTADEQGAWIAPPEASLLATVWEQAGGQFLPLDGVVPERAENVFDYRLLRRVATPEALPEALPASDPQGLEANIPSRDGDPHAAAVGTVVHLTLERLSQGPLPERFDPAAFEPWWRRELSALGVCRTAQALAQIAESIAGVLADERGRWLLSQQRQEAASEFRVSRLLQDGTVGDYVIDRVYVEDNIRWVVDYKSSVPDSGESLQDFIERETERHLPQLENYRWLMQSLDERPVRCALYFTALPHWQELPEK
jgi:ATP-dependent exoDNAse (exonuclease V) beta subunit